MSRIDSLLAAIEPRTTLAQTEAGDCLAQAKLYIQRAAWKLEGKEAP